MDREEKLRRGREKLAKFQEKRRKGKKNAQHVTALDGQANLSVVPVNKVSGPDSTIQEDTLKSSSAANSEEAGPEMLGSGRDELNVPVHANRSAGEKADSMDGITNSLLDDTEMNSCIGQSGPPPSYDSGCFENLSSPNDELGISCASDAAQTLMNDRSIGESSEMDTTVLHKIRDMLDIDVSAALAQAIHREMQKYQLECVGRIDAMKQSAKIEMQNLQQSMELRLQDEKSRIFEENKLEISQMESLKAATEAQISTLRIENEALERQVENMNASLKVQQREYDHQIANLENDLEEQRRIISSAQNEANDQESKSKEALDRLEQGVDAVNKLRSDLNNTLHELSVSKKAEKDAVQQMDAVKVECEALKERLAESGRVMSVLREEKEGAERSLHGKLEDANLRIVELTKSLEDAKQDLSREIESRLDLVHQVEEGTLSMKRMRQENDRWRASSKDWESRACDAESKLESALSTSETNISEAAQRTLDAESRVSELQGHLQDQRLVMETLQAEIKRLQSRADSSENKVTEVRHAASIRTQAAETAKVAVEQQCEALRKRLVELQQSQADQSSAHKSDMDELRDANRHLSSQIELLEAKVESWKAKASAEASGHSAADATIQSLNTRMNELQEQLRVANDHLDEERGAKGERESILSKTIQSLRLALEEEKQLVIEHRSKADTSEKRLKDVLSESASRFSVIESLRCELESCRTKVETAHSKIEASAKRCEQLEFALLEEKRLSEHKLQAAKKDVQDMDVQLKEYASLIRTLSGKHVELGSFPTHLSESIHSALQHPACTETPLKQGRLSLPEISPSLLSSSGCLPHPVAAATQAQGEMLTELLKEKAALGEALAEQASLTETLLAENITLRRQYERSTVSNKGLSESERSARENNAAADSDQRATAMASAIKKMAHARNVEAEVHQRVSDLVNTVQGVVSCHTERKHASRIQTENETKNPGNEPEARTLNFDEDTGKVPDAQSSSAYHRSMLDAAVQTDALQQPRSVSQKEGPDGRETDGAIQDRKSPASTDTSPSRMQILEYNSENYDVEDGTEMADIEAALATVIFGCKQVSHHPAAELQTSPMHQRYLSPGSLQSESTNQDDAPFSAAEGNDISLGSHLSNQSVNQGAHASVHVASQCGGTVSSRVHASQTEISNQVIESVLERLQDALGYLTGSKDSIDQRPKGSLEDVSDAILSKSQLVAAELSKLRLSVSRRETDMKEVAKRWETALTESSSLVDSLGSTNAEQAAQIQTLTSDCESALARLKEWSGWCMQLLNHERQDAGVSNRNYSDSTLRSLLSIKLQATAGTVPQTTTTVAPTDWSPSWPASLRVFRCLVAMVVKIINASPSLRGRRKFKAIVYAIVCAIRMKRCAHSISTIDSSRTPQREALTQAHMRLSFGRTRGRDDENQPENEHAVTKYKSKYKILKRKYNQSTNLADRFAKENALLKAELEISKAASHAPGRRVAASRATNSAAAHGDVARVTPRSKSTSSAAIATPDSRSVRQGMSESTTQTGKRKLTKRKTSGGFASNRKSGLQTHDVISSLPVTSSKTQIRVARDEVLRQLTQTQPVQTPETVTSLRHQLRSLERLLALA